MSGVAPGHAGRALRLAACLLAACLGHAGAASARAIAGDEAHTPVAARASLPHPDRLAQAGLCCTPPPVGVAPPALPAPYLTAPPQAPAARQPAPGPSVSECQRLVAPGAAASTVCLPDAKASGGTLCIDVPGGGEAAQDSRLRAQALGCR